MPEDFRLFKELDEQTFNIALERIKKLEKIKADLQLRNSLIYEQALLFKEKLTGNTDESYERADLYAHHFNKQFKQYLTMGDSND